MNFLAQTPTRRFTIQENEERYDKWETTRLQHNKKTFKIRYYFLDDYSSKDVQGRKTLLICQQEQVFTPALYKFDTKCITEQISHAFIEYSGAGSVTRDEFIGQSHYGYFHAGATYTENNGIGRRSRKGVSALPAVKYSPRSGTVIFQFVVRRLALSYLTFVLGTILCKKDLLQVRPPTCDLCV